MPKKNSVPNTVTVTLETDLLKYFIQEREEAEDYDFLPDIQQQLAQQGISIRGEREFDSWPYNIEFHIPHPTSLAYHKIPGITVEELQRREMWEKFRAQLERGDI